MTPYNEHKEIAAETPADHRITRHSPNGVDLIEECSCGRRFLHNPCIGYPLTLDWRKPQVSRSAAARHATNKE